VNLRILALDFDGTIAANDVLDPGAAEAIQEARAAGLLVVLATGRILDDLDPLLPATPLFDAVVAENGAVLRLAGQPSPTVLGRPPQPAFLESLRRSAIPHRSGRCVVEASAQAAPRVLDAIRRLGAPLGLSFNRDRLMVLPEGVTKGSGLQEALWRLRASGHNALAIGDAENDHSLLEACEFGAAVSSGSASLREAAEIVIPGNGPGAVARFVRGLVPVRRMPLALSRRRWIRVGARGSGAPLDLALRGRNILIGGDPRSGKSWITGLICEELILQRYSLCILDPEGDYACLEPLPGVIVHPVASEDASLSGIERILSRPDLSLVVDMSGAAPADKPRVVRRVVGLANHLRRQTGLPHRIVIDEAHYFLGRLDDPELFDSELGGYLIVTYRIADLSAEILAAADAVIVTKVVDQRQALALRALGPPVGTTSEWLDSLASLAIDEAMLLPGAQESSDRLTRFRIAPRMTAHVRHRQKYRDVPVPAGREFVFTRHGQETGQRARSLADLVELLPTLPDDVLAGHLRRGDFHRWAERVLGDSELGGALRGAEGLEAGRAREAIAEAISGRYGGSST
jgi:hydroxymethylpyrimidine pyrophosphatase-like HAD family hydrolase